MSNGPLQSIPENAWVSGIADRLRAPLPGIPAQAIMAPAGRISSDYDPTPAGARQSAVLLLITSARELVFIRRAEDGRPHGGQIAFPGGMREDHDPDLETTARRETEEEIGVPRDLPRTLGPLSPLYIPVTNFTVWPFVATIPAFTEFALQPEEVDEVLWFPIDSFQSALAEMDWTYDGTVYRVPAYRFGDAMVWGATAMIAAEFLVVWNESVGI